MNRHVAVWALGALLAGSAPMARGQSAGSDAVQGSDAGVERTKSGTTRMKDAPSDVRNQSPTKEVPSSDNTSLGASGKARTKDAELAPSDVRALDPTRETPSEQNTKVGAPGAKRRKDARKPAPSDVRKLDPTRENTSTENQEKSRTGEPGK